LHKKRTGKAILTFFLFCLCLPICAAQDSIISNYPVIASLDSRDLGFKQFINDVENNRRFLFSRRNNPEEAAANLTIYQYITRPGDDIFSLAARCNVPYSALVSLNRLRNSASIETGIPILLPSCPGLFIPASLDSDLERLLGAGRLAEQESIVLNISMAGMEETFYFFPGADFNPTERTFFLNPGFRFPLASYRITSAFGIRQNPVTGNIALHQGIDLAAPEGTGVYSIADGVVTEIGVNSVLGNYIVINHGNNLTSLYGHLQKVEVLLRSQVKSGSLIGRVGSTGQSTGPHLHLELRQNGRALDPAGRLRH
jgi:murein DD-endopeptidase MepM/ murein hydrolase activator NlpD